MTTAEKHILIHFKSYVFIKQINFEKLLLSGKRSHFKKLSFEEIES